MTKIVVGFDFSSGSAYAVDLSIDIANRWQCDICLVYVKEKKEDESPIRAEIEQRIAAVGHLLKGIRLDYVIRSGNPADELVAQAKEVSASLVVVGSHGMSGLKKNMLGRNSYRTIEESPAPVLIVREDFNISKKLETIVVPIDSSDDTRQKVGMAATFAKSFGSTIHILGLATSKSQDVQRIVQNYVKMVERHLDKMEVKYVSKFIEDVKNVTQTTLEYANMQNAGMIAIMTEQESNLSSLILGTYAQQMINQSNIPVLSVRPKQVVTDNVNY